jgi:hypothetical protein
MAHGYKQLTRAQVIEINDFWKSGALEIHDDKTCEYNDGWTDNKLADKFGVNYSHIANLRIELHGHLRKKDPDGSQKNNPLVNLWTRLKALEDEHDVLKGRVRDLEDAATKPGDNVRTGLFGHKSNGSV